MTFTHFQKKNARISRYVGISQNVIKCIKLEDLFMQMVLFLNWIFFIFDIKIFVVIFY